MHLQEPAPQSIEPVLHSCEQNVPLQTVAFPAGTHESGWQQVAATQSVSTTHSPIVWLSAGSYLLKVNHAIVKAIIITKIANQIFIGKRKTS
jgi:hypothetical protein